MINQPIKNVLSEDGQKEVFIAHDPRIDIVIEEIRGTESVLDMGCVQHNADRASTGQWLHGELASIVNDLVGLDYLPTEVKKLNARGYDVVQGNAEEFSLNRKFDTIVAGELIEHLGNPGSFLTSVREHLHDNGQLVLTTPNPWYIRRFAEALSGRVRSNSEHTCWFDERTLRQLLERHEFTVTDFHYAPAPRFCPRHTPMNLESYATTTLYHAGFRLLGGYSLIVVATPCNRK